MRETAPQAVFVECGVARKWRAAGTFHPDGMAPQRVGRGPGKPCFILLTLRRAYSEAREGVEGRHPWALPLPPGTLAPKLACHATPSSVPCQG